MQKEAKWNAIFLTILIIILIPGAVILVRKKLDPNSRRMGEPDPVRKTTAYIDPFDVPDTFRRLVPPKAEAWTASLLPAGAATTLNYKGTPVVSEARQFEVLTFTRNAKGVAFTALIWNLPDGKPALEVKAKAAVGKDAIDPLELRHESVAIPKEVRDELRYAGFIKPPFTAELVKVQFADLPDPTPKKPVELMLQVYQQTAAKPDFVRIFTNPAFANPEAR